MRTFQVKRLKRHRPFLIESNINICSIMGVLERIEFKRWNRAFNEVLGAYNKTEKLLIFLIYKKGYSRVKIKQKTGLSKYSYDKFSGEFKNTDEYNILKAPDEYCI